MRDHEPVATRMPFLADDGGFTQLGVVLSMLLALSLLSMSVQAYWVRTNSADIQQAADAGALAATNVVDEYLVVARVADAIALSMSLLGLTLYAASAVAACIPFAEGVSAPLSEAAQKVLKQRDTFANKAMDGLDHLQKVLPFLCAANAIAVIQANAEQTNMEAGYVGLAVPVSLEGAGAEIEDDEQTDTSGKKIEQNNDEAQKSSEEAQQAEAAMNAARERGFHADCDESGSQWERAGHLGGLAGAANPRYSSSELWNFDVAIQRAQVYYQTREATEQVQGGGMEELSNSVARMSFYRYAARVVQRAGTYTDAQGTQRVDMPVLPRNTADVRGTALYTEAVYPVSSDGSGLTLHCSTDCPAYGTPAGVGSVSQIDAGTVRECPVCSFSVSDLGSAPAASTNIDNGFEYYYREVALAAADYTKAAGQYEEASQKAKETTQKSVDEYAEALKSLSGRRYDPQPPGRFGCICVVFDGETHSVPNVLTSFVGGGVQIDPRVAISAAMLAPEDPVEGANVISSLLDGVVAAQPEEGSGWVGGAAGWLVSQLIGVWGNLLLAYSNGAEGLEAGTESLLSSIPGVSSTGLSSWARGLIEDTLELVGIQPVKMESYKPVLVNSSHVLAHADGQLDDVLSAARNSYEFVDSEYVVATVQLADGLPTFDVKVALPTGESDGGEMFGEEWGGQMDGTEEVRVWE